MKLSSYLVSGVALCLVQACGSGDSADTLELIPAAPTFSLSISDAPVQDALQVVACFSEIELKAVDSPNNATFLIGANTSSATPNDLCSDAQGVVDANTRGIDLLSLSGIASEQIFSNINIGVGVYSQLRLTISDNSYVIVDLDKDGIGDDVDNDGNPDKLPIKVPSKELKLDGFTVTQGQHIDLTLEFDLRKGMTNPVGQEGYILKPRGVRLVDNSISGHIQGTVSETLLINNVCNVAPTNAEDSVAYVYLFEGINLDNVTLADNGGNEGLEALTSVPVLYDSAGSYSFEIGFVPAAPYTLALTCDEDSDPEGDDELNFIKIIEATVADKTQTTNVEFNE
jgi:hypothetical protein